MVIYLDLGFYEVMVVLGFISFYIVSSICTFVFLTKAELTDTGARIKSGEIEKSTVLVEVLLSISIAWPGLQSDFVSVRTIVFKSVDSLSTSSKAVAVVAVAGSAVTVVAAIVSVVEVAVAAIVVEVVAAVEAAITVASTVMVRSAIAVASIVVVDATLAVAVAAVVVAAVAY